MAQIDLQPVTVRRQPARRLPQLAIGLTLYGTSMAMMTRANLGLSPWDVLHQGIMFRTGWTFGTITFVVAAAVLLLWLPLRQRLGIGTVANVIVIAITVDLGGLLLAAQHTLWIQYVLFFVGVVLNSFAI